MRNSNKPEGDITALDFDIDTMELPQYRKGATERPRSSSFTWSPYRRRRIIWVVVFVFLISFFFLAPESVWERSPEIWKGLGEAWVPVPPSDASMHEEISLDRINEQLGSPDINFDKSKEVLEEPAPINAPGATVDALKTELHHFLHMVASSELTIPEDVDPSKPLDIDVYSVNLAGDMPPGVGGGVDVSWLQAQSRDAPVIVFSKTYCPYSKKAKALFSQYDLSPPPKIVEVDLRSDSDAIKTILTRLTNHATFPNVFIAEKSLGGSDDLEKLHESGELTKLLTAAGVDIKGGIADME